MGVRLFLLFTFYFRLSTPNKIQCRYPVPPLYVGGIHILAISFFPTGLGEEGGGYVYSGEDANLIGNAQGWYIPNLPCSSNASTGKQNKSR